MWIRPRCSRSFKAPILVIGIPRFTGGSGFPDQHDIIIAVSKIDAAEN